MYLLIDQGNSRCKYLLTGELGGALSSVEQKAIEQGAWDNANFDDEIWKLYLAAFESRKIKAVLVSSVASQDRKDWFAGLCQEVLGITAQFAVSAESYVKSNARKKNDPKLVNSYSTSQALGVDRWLAMIAAFERVDTDFVVMDAGTAITTDWVDQEGQHQGGHIVAGGQMLQSSLMGTTGGIAWSASHDGSLEQQDVDAESSKHLLGQNTTAAVALGAETMIQGYCHQLLRQFSEQAKLETISFLVTGGDGKIIAEWLQQAVDLLELDYAVNYYPNLVFEGLSYSFALNN